VSRLTRPLAELLCRPHGDWQPLIDAWAASARGRRLIQAVDARVAAGAAVYPAEVFRALELTPLAHTRVVILGQDPYHGAGQAEGLAFSVPDGARKPPSLRNIFRELQRDLGCPVPAMGSLQHWARQGVLLLNTALTVEDGQAASHAKLGWEALTDEIVVAAATDPRPKVFMLWGAHAGSKAQRVAGGRHLMLQCNHPSPLSATRGPAPFIGCGHFRRALEFLVAETAGPRLEWCTPARTETAVSVV
jgi:uracil-DNA glycosylase